MRRPDRCHRARPARGARPQPGAAQVRASDPNRADLPEAVQGFGNHGAKAHQPAVPESVLGHEVIAMDSVRSAPTFESRTPPAGVRATSIGPRPARFGRRTGATGHRAAGQRMAARNHSAFPPSGVGTGARLSIGAESIRKLQLFLRKFSSSEDRTSSVLAFGHDGRPRAASSGLRRLSLQPTISGIVALLCIAPAPEAWLSACAPRRLAR